MRYSPLVIISVIWTLIAPGRVVHGQTTADRKASVEQSCFMWKDSTRVTRPSSFGAFVARCRSSGSRFRDSTRYVGEAMPWSEFLSYARRIRDRRTPAPTTSPKEITVFDVMDQTATAKLTAWWLRTIYCSPSTTGSG